MSGQKKHPLEVFKASGRPLGDRAVTPAERSKKTDEAAAHGDVAEGSGSEFELRLALPGAIILLFVWLVLMGAAYVYGYSRGDASAADEVNRVARAKGLEIEQGAGRAVTEQEAGVPATSPFPYGVLLITYSTYKQERIDQMEAILARNYGIRGLIPWVHRDDTTEVFVGEFESREDPELEKLAARLRGIDDYPSGSKRPFATALVKQHPGDPESARKAGN